MAGRRILVLGATSAIAQSYARLRAGEGAACILVGRHRERLDAVAADLRARGAASTDVLVADLAAVDAIDANAKALARHLDAADEVLIAYGVLGETAVAERDPSAARKLLDTNFTSVALWVLTILQDRPANRPLTVIVIGSVAGDRGRASNYIYGAAKGGLDRLLEGLAQKYDGTAIRILTVKPGFVDTPMTAAIKKSGPLWASPEKVAADMHRAVARGKRVIYTPWFWWPIMLIIRHLPWFVFKRLKV